MSVFTDLFKKIGQFFKGLFNAAEKAYNSLTPEEQLALQHGSGLLAIINEMTNATPEAVRKAILAKFPHLDVKKMEEALFQVAQVFKLNDKIDNLDDAIKALQEHLQQLEGKNWATFSHAVASLLAVVFAPPSTKVAAIVSLIEWVYRRFIKK